MSGYLSKCVFWGCLYALCFSSTAFAVPTDAKWQQWFQNQIDLHPEVIAAKEAMNSRLSLADGRARPLYNPELAAEFEREGSDDNYRIGINQTVDWWHKRAVRKQQAVYSRTAARRAFEYFVQRRKADALRALIAWRAAQQQADLAGRQESQLAVLVELVNERQQTGDLGQIDAQLTFLNVSQTLNATAQALANLRQAEVRVRELLPGWSPQWSQIPGRLLLTQGGSANTALTGNSANTQQWVDANPVVITARAEWEVVQQAAVLARRNSKADPTFGINAGKMGEEDAIGLTFSIPLNVRNNYNAETRAANQQALSAEANYRAVRRSKQLAIEASRNILQEYRQRYNRWQSLLQGRDTSSARLLEKQWRSGDLSTMQYLLALQQRSEGLVAGIELQTHFQLAQIDWLLQTGQINTALSALQQPVM